MTKQSSNHPGSTRSNPHSKFSKKQVRAIVEEIDSGALSRTEACSKYGICYSTVLDWMKRHSEAAAGTKRTQLSRQQQREVARVIAQGRMTVKACFQNDGKTIISRQQIRNRQNQPLNPKKQILLKKLSLYSDCRIIMNRCIAVAGFIYSPV